MLFCCSGGLTTHNLWLQDQRQSCESICNSRPRRPWRWSHQNCLNMCLGSYNHAAPPPAKEEPCIYTKAAFASHIKTTSTSIHRQTDKNPHGICAKQSTDQQSPSRTSIRTSQITRTVSSNPRSNAGNHSTTCYFSNDTSLPPDYALGYNNNSSAPRTSRRPMGPHDFRNGLHRFVLNSTRNKTK